MRRGTEAVALIIIVGQGAIASTTVQNGPMVTMATVITSPIGPTNILSHKMTPSDLKSHNELR